MSDHIDTPRQPTVRLGTARLALLAMLVLITAAILWAPPAWAHTRLDATEPATDETTDEPFDAVVLIFSQAVQSDFAEVEVTDPAGTRLDVGDPVYDGERVEQPITELEDVGEYTVEWRVVALDGHPIDGTFVFEYDGPLPEDEAEEEEPVEPEMPEEPAPEPEAAEEEPTEADEPDVTEDETETEAVAAPGGGSGSGGMTGPIGLAALVLVLTAGAAVYAIRAIRAWGPVSTPQTG